MKTKRTAVRMKRSENSEWTRGSAWKAWVALTSTQRKHVLSLVGATKDATRRFNGVNFFPALPKWIRVRLKSQFSSPGGTSHVREHLSSKGEKDVAI